jgi:hypothetical protein
MTSRSIRRCAAPGDERAVNDKTGEISEHPKKVAAEITSGQVRITAYLRGVEAYLIAGHFGFELSNHQGVWCRKVPVS